jgi:hypothetical protein
MRERLDTLPRSVRVAAVLMVVVPALLWLFLVWDTRPYSYEEIAADRAHVEASPSYERAVDECSSSSMVLPSLSLDGPGFVFPTPSQCREKAFETFTSLTRNPVQIGGEARDTGSLALLSMAAAALIVGVRWRAGPGAGAFLRRVGKVFLLGTIAALVAGTSWWWGLDWIAERRGVMDSAPPAQFIVSGATLVGLTGVVGLALRALLRGSLRRIVTISAAAVALGLVALVARPIQPWLPLLNVEAFLAGGENYDIPPDQVVCTPTDHDTLTRIGGYPGLRPGTRLLHPRLTHAHGRGSSALPVRGDRPPRGARRLDQCPSARHEATRLTLCHSHLTTHGGRGHE